jgi:DNA-binding YbaB/EbfC family protein
MTQNPFGGEGGFDMNALLQQAQQMQEQLMSAQAQLEEAEVEGTVAGGAVTVRVSGTGELLGVDIRAGGFDANDADDLSDLGDMIVAAWRDAKSRADALASEQLGPLAGGLGGIGGDAGGGPGEIPGGGQPFGFGGPPPSGPGTPGLGG